MTAQGLAAVPRAMVGPGKGILALRPSLPGIRVRMTSISIEPTGNSRRAFRQMPLMAPAGAGFVSGVIAFGETLQHTLETA